MQPSEPSIHRSSSPMRVVSDPRKKSGKESDVSSEKMMVQEEIQESPQDDSSVVSGVAPAMHVLHRNYVCVVTQSHS